MLQGWNDRDVHSFATLLRRFTDDFQRSNETAPTPGGRSAPRTDQRFGGSN
jgi:hypothetical protein